MSITCDKSRNDIANAVDRRMALIHKAILYKLSWIGEKAVNVAREYNHGKDYKDQTNNLRSSIGFVISFNGSIVKWGDFKATGSGEDGDGSKGVGTGKEFATKIGTDVKDGYCLTIVAGMEYARYVMDMGYDVLQSSEQQAQRDAEKLAKQILGMMI